MMCYYLNVQFQHQRVKALTAVKLRVTVYWITTYSTLKSKVLYYAPPKIM